VDALTDGEFVPAGTLVRIRTTGGGGWGDPLERDPAFVARDVRWGKVSRAAAAADYGVVLTGPAADPVVDDPVVDDLVVDDAATRVLRDRRRAARPASEPFFDRGPGYRVLSGGLTAASVDWL
jgi:N-methylhydantoinase B